MTRWPHKSSPEEIAERRARLRELKGWRAESEVLFSTPAPAESYAGMVDAFTAGATLPVSMVGPLKVSLGRYQVDEAGEPAEVERNVDEVVIPLAHTEGGLAASMQRGMNAVLRGEPIATHVIRDRMTRDSCFQFESAEQAVAFARWAVAETPNIRNWLHDRANPLYAERLAGVPVLSRHARLWEIETHVVGAACHLLYGFTTGDACGPNMITRNAYAINTHFVLRRFPAASGFAPLRVMVEANMGGDKKPSGLYFTSGGHGKTVIASVRVLERVLRRVLHTTSDDLLALEHLAVHGGIASGMQSAAFTPASSVAAIFAATGQDLGMVATSSMAQDVLDRCDDGLHLAIRFSGLEVGTVGGGTGLPHARALLGLLGCLEPGGSLRLAQIIAASALCLELSAAAAAATAGSRDFVSAHTRHSGR